MVSCDLKLFKSTRATDVWANGLRRQSRGPIGILASVHLKVLVYQNAVVTMVPMPWALPVFNALVGRTHPYAALLHTFFFGSIQSNTRFSCTLGARASKILKELSGANHSSTQLCRVACLSLLVALLSPSSHHKHHHLMLLLRIWPCHKYDSHQPAGKVQ